MSIHCSGRWLVEAFFKRSLFLLFLLQLQESSNALPGSIISQGNFVGAATGQPANSSPENALDDILKEIAAEPSVIPQKHRLGLPEPPRRLPSYPSTESGGGSPVRNWESPLKMHPPKPSLPPKPKLAPPPPPRISSKSPLVSPSIESGDSTSGESINSQQDGRNLSERHLELLRKQRQLQEQYNRLQMIQQRTAAPVSGNSDKVELKKTGSETDLRGKLGLQFSAAPTGSLSNINKPLYETDIL